MCGQLRARHDRRMSLTSRDIWRREEHFTVGSRNRRLLKNARTRVNSSFTCAAISFSFAVDGLGSFSYSASRNSLVAGSNVRTRLDGGARARDGSLALRLRKNTFTRRWDSRHCLASLAMVAASGFLQQANAGGENASNGG